NPDLGVVGSYSLYILYQKGHFVGSTQVCLARAVCKRKLQPCILGLYIQCCADRVAGVRGKICRIICTIIRTIEYKTIRAATVEGSPDLETPQFTRCKYTCLVNVCTGLYYGVLVVIP